MEQLYIVVDGFGSFFDKGDVLCKSKTTRSLERFPEDGDYAWFYRKEQGEGSLEQLMVQKDYTYISEVTGEEEHIGKNVIPYSPE